MCLGFISDDFLSPLTLKSSKGVRAVEASNHIRIGLTFIVFFLRLGLSPNPMDAFQND